MPVITCPPLARVLIPTIAAGILTACGGSSPGSSSPPTQSSTFTIGGTIGGLGSSASLVLANGSDTYDVPANATTFIMPTALANGVSYDVTVKTNPTAVQCNVVNGAGTVNGVNVTSISVSCQAGTESLLYSFSGGTTDGTTPLGLIQAIDGSFYGVTELGGANNRGTFFNLTPSGATESVLYSFGSTDTDGVPNSSIIQATDGNFYGAGIDNPTPGLGTIYKINPAGTIEENLYTFTGGTTDGAYPQQVIQASDGSFYGITQMGGASNDGAVFKITQSGIETVFYSFTGGTTGGASPSSLIQGSDANFYGTATAGGAGNDGVVFKITPAGTETILHSFTGGTTDGSNVRALIEGNDGNLYGVTLAGGPSNDGAVFKLTLSGTETLIYFFEGGPADGSGPNALTQASDGNLYGTTGSGGASGVGTIFKISPTAETILHSFSGGPTDGAGPYGGLIQATNGGLYGVTFYGGSSNDGAIYEVD